MDDVSVSNSELLETTDSEDDTVNASDDKLHKEGESESLSDIDDAEVGSYLFNKKEKDYRKIIWEMMNKKYLQEQAEKVAAAANGTDSKRELKNKKTASLKKAQSTAKRTRPASPKKRPNFRINYDALSKVLDEPLPSDSSKKRRSEPDSDKHVGETSIRSQVNDDAGNKTEDEEYGGEDHSNYPEYNNQEDEYDYYDDDEDFF